MSQEEPPPAGPQRLRRQADLALYRADAIHAVVDACPIAHIAFVHEGLPVAIPMAVWRSGSHLYFHAANKGRLATVCAGADVCISMACFDGLVLARSAFNHSFNYRSVVVHGRADVVEDESERLAALRAFMEQLLPGRWQELRPVHDNEMRATVILRVDLACAAAKVRVGDPTDEAEDGDWPVWVGVLPQSAMWQAPRAAATLLPDLPLPAYLQAFLPA